MKVLFTYSKKLVNDDSFLFKRGKNALFIDILGFERYH